jgi:hypothetical protein
MSKRRRTQRGSLGGNRPRLLYQRANALPSPLPATMDEKTDPQNATVSTIIGSEMPIEFTPARLVNGLH